MAGPTAASIRSGRAPSERIACMAAPVTPATVPRQPACTQPSTCASGSTRMIGTQSATSTTSTVPGSRVTTASVCTIESARRSVPRPRSAAVTVATWLPCDWSQNTNSARSAPSAAASRRRFSSTAVGSSPTCSARFSDA